MYVQLPSEAVVRVSGWPCIVHPSGFSPPSAENTILVVTAFSVFSRRLYESTLYFVASVAEARRVR